MTTWHKTEQVLRFECSCSDSCIPWTSPWFYFSAGALYKQALLYHKEWMWTIFFFLLLKFQSKYWQHFIVSEKVETVVLCRKEHDANLQGMWQWAGRSENRKSAQRQTCEKKKVWENDWSGTHSPENKVTCYRAISDKAKPNWQPGNVSSKHCSCVTIRKL